MASRARPTLRKVHIWLFRIAPQESITNSDVQFKKEIATQSTDDSRYQHTQEKIPKALCALKMHFKNTACLFALELPLQKFFQETNSCEKTRCDDIFSKARYEKEDGHFIQLAAKPDGARGASFNLAVPERTLMKGYRTYVGTINYY